jgi:hypothetical protein
MSERRALRLLVEVAFLAALAAALTFADLAPFETVGVMVLGWLLVVVFEWGAWRGRPHFGSGLPPRWYLPRVTLPPPRPLEQFSAGYPAAEAGADAPTWIASPAMLAEWPVAEREPDAELETPVDEATHVHELPELEELLALEPPEEVAEPEPEPEEEPEELAEPKPATEPEPEEPIEPAPPPTAASAAGRTARHRIDPLAAPPAKARRFGKRAPAAIVDLDVPAGPPPGRMLPAQATPDEQR